MLGERTYTVAQLGEELKLFLGEAFREIWVVGEVQRLRESTRGHVYFELVEKGARDSILGKLEAVIWRTDHLRVRRTLVGAGQELVEGVSIRCRANLDFYGPMGRLQLAVREIDPWFTLGDLARRRREVLADLAQRNLLERNRSRPLARLPLRVGLVTSHDSAAYHDFLATLAESGFGFQVLLVHAAVQGVGADRQVASAIGLLGEAGVDAIALVRGGGARSDLATFDSRLVAEAVAGSPVPVLTGLGHEIDETIADQVAHTALKTPTKVGEMLVARVAAEDLRLRGLGEALGVLASRRLAQASAVLAPLRLRFAAAHRLLTEGRAKVVRTVDLLQRIVTSRLRRDRHLLHSSVQRLADSAPASIRRREIEADRTRERLIRFSGHLVAAHGRRLAALERLIVGLSPQRTLERGFSITRRSSGEAVRHPKQVRGGDQLNTETAGGRLTSRVEEG